MGYPSSITMVVLHKNAEHEVGFVVSFIDRPYPLKKWTRLPVGDKASWNGQVAGHIDFSPA